MGGGAVSVPSPRGDKGCEVAVFLGEGDGMVAVPGVEDGFFRVAWDGSGLVEWGLSVVCLPCGVLAKLLEVNGSPERPILFGTNDHAMTPSVWGAHGDLFQYSEADIPVETGLHLVLPVDGNGNGCVAGFGDGGGVNVEAQWGARHHGEGLMLTNIECTGRVDVTQVLLELASVGLCGQEWEAGGSGGRWGPGGA